MIAPVVRTPFRSRINRGEAGPGPAAGSPTPVEPCPAHRRLPVLCLPLLVLTALISATGFITPAALSWAWQTASRPAVWPALATIYLTVKLSSTLTVLCLWWLGRSEMQAALRRVASLQSRLDGPNPGAGSGSLGVPNAA